MAGIHRRGRQDRPEHGDPDRDLRGEPSAERGSVEGPGRAGCRREPAQRDGSVDQLFAEGDPGSRMSRRMKGCRVSA